MLQLTLLGNQENGKKLNLSITQQAKDVKTGHSALKQNCWTVTDTIFSFLQLVAKN